MSLVEAQETITSDECSTTFNTLSLLKVEYELRSLPSINFFYFNCNPSRWLEFIETFSKQVHYKNTSSRNKRMERL